MHEKQIKRNIMSDLVLEPGLNFILILSSRDASAYKMGFLVSGNHWELCKSCHEKPLLDDLMPPIASAAHDQYDKWQVNDLFVIFFAQFSDSNT